MWNFQLISLILASVIVTQAALVDQTNLQFYYGSTTNDYRVYAHNKWNLIMLDPAFDPNRPTAFYIHGFTQAPNTSEVQTVIQAYLKRNTHNLVVFDWSKLSSGEYFTNAVPNAVAVGPIIGEDVLAAIQGGLNVDTLHVIGHSLGAQLSGYIGRQVTTSSNGDVTLSRITGLDPAGPAFFAPLLMPGLKHLSASDANFVDIIHSDAEMAGQPCATGTADFWPNDGRYPQPGCSTSLMKIVDGNTCSHGRSVLYYAESVGSLNPAFLAVSAANWSDFQAGNVDNSNAATMGIDCDPTTASGSYYLQTGSATPYALDANDK